MFACLIINLQSKETWRSAVRPRLYSCSMLWKAYEDINGVGLRAVLKGESLGRALLGGGLFALNYLRK